MKYQLKRQINVNMIIYGVFAIIGVLCFLLCSKYENRAGGIVFVILGIGGMIYEIYKSKGPVLIFDENGFYIGDSRYSYSDIERIDSTQIRRMKYVSIIIDSKTVFEFDNGYENYKEFVKQLTLSGVEHNLFG